MKRGGIVAALCIGLHAAATAFANPTGPTVVSGTAQVQQVGPTLQVTTSTTSTIINWSNFSIGAGETTSFAQPSSLSITLNRVTGGNPSQIFGTLTSNGQVYVANTSGLLIGAGAQVNTAGFLATTGNISDSSFLTGNMQPTGGSFLQIDGSFSGVLNMSGGTVEIVDITSGNLTITSANVILAGTVAAASPWADTGVGLQGVVAGNSVTLNTSNVGVSGTTFTGSNVTVLGGGSGISTFTASSAGTPSGANAAPTAVNVAVTSIAAPAVSVNLQKREPLY